MVIDAVLMAEDRRFWIHAGVDPLAVARALHVNLKRNEVQQGASTITQQVARTVFLDTRRTWGRKLSLTRPRGWPAPSARPIGCSLVREWKQRSDATRS